MLRIEVFSGAGIGHRTGVVAVLLAGTIALPTGHGPTVHADPIRGVVRQVRTFDDDRTSVVDPRSVTYSATAGTLYVTSNHRTTGPAGPVDALDVISLDETGRALTTARLPLVAGDPINTAFDAAHGRMLFIEGPASGIVSVPERSGRGLDPASRTRFPMAGWGVRDPQGIATDPSTGEVFVLDASTRASCASAQRLTVGSPDRGVRSISQQAASPTPAVSRSIRRPVISM